MEFGKFVGVANKDKRMSNYRGRSQLYIMDYRMKGGKYKIGLAARSQENNKNGECTEIMEMAANCARSHTCCNRVSKISLK